jgi:hypothetical protein
MDEFDFPYRLWIPNMYCVRNHLMRLMTLLLHQACASRSPPSAGLGYCSLVLGLPRE